jgi:hypothetical protein
LIPLFYHLISLAITAKMMAMKEMVTKETNTTVQMALTAKAATETPITYPHLRSSVGIFHLVQPRPLVVCEYVKVQSLAWIHPRPTVPVEMAMVEE